MHASLQIRPRLHFWLEKHKCAGCHVSARRQSCRRVFHVWKKQRQHFTLNLDVFGLGFFYPFFRSNPRNRTVAMWKRLKARIAGNRVAVGLSNDCRIANWPAPSFGRETRPVCFDGDAVAPGSLQMPERPFLGRMIEEPSLKSVALTALSACSLNNCS